MTTLTNFNNFELNTNETNNVNGGCYRRRRRTSYSSCYYSNCYSNCYYSSCEPAEETVVEATPVIETPAVIETPESLTPPRGVAGL